MKANRLCAVVAAVTLAVAGNGGAAPARAAGCIGSGTEVDINAALAGVGTVVELCPGATFLLSNPVGFTAPNQRLRTQGLPTDGSRATLLVVSAALTVAVLGNGQPGVVLENVQVDGNRQQFGWMQSHALVLMGGLGADQTVQNIVARNTRSWSSISFHEGQFVNNVPLCQRARVLNNEVGPAGETVSPRWADGISIACRDSLIQGNTIRDATDGAIVLFGSTGSLVQGNTIIAETRDLLGGINMVDSTDGVNGNYAGVRVDGNTIDARSAHIKIAIGQGPRIWGWCDSPPRLNSGGSVTNNVLRGLHMGYGFAVSGVSNWTVTGNVDQSRHVGRPGNGCDGALPKPAGFLVQTTHVTHTTLQPEFRFGNVSNALNITEPDILRLPVRPPSRCGIVGPGEGLYPDQSVFSCDGRLELRMQGDGNLVLSHAGTVLWASNTGALGGVQLLVQGDGNAVVFDGAGGGPFTTRTGGNPGASLVLQGDGNLVLSSPSGVALWASNTSIPPPCQGYTWFADKVFVPGEFYTTCNGTLSMQEDGNLVIYSQSGRALWSTGTGGWAGSHARFQSDGNLVIYSPSGFALWASNSTIAAGGRIDFQVDGNLVIYAAAGFAAWATNTHGD